ncbi:uncharacterized protein LOC116619357 [Nematostella vectensis]|uniref:uncharacterized protein LOC116619357 n=1 Tax=Nematostella vectensis TaxID=45351 RepID=UPI00138FD5B7|nr:uncharacterized protein LOC116619357 [Nematostella vectensis]
MDFVAESKPYRIALYFLTLVGSLLFVLWKAVGVSLACRSLPKRWLVFPLLGFTSITVAWREIYMFMVEGAREFPDFRTYLKESEIIVEAYSVVTNTNEGYWWSSQLLMFVLPYVVFINTKARQINIPTLELCAYTWLGFGGAISTSFALFIYRYDVTTYMKTTKELTIVESKIAMPGIAALFICLWSGYMNTIFLYTSVDSSFKAYLLLLHVFLFLPSLLPALQMKHKDNILDDNLKGFVPLLYALLAFFIACHHFYFSHTILHSDFAPEAFVKLIASGFDHHSQNGISSDLVFSFLVCVCYFLVKPIGTPASSPVLIPFICLTPCFSLGCTFSLVMLYDEFLQENKTKQKTE